MSLTDEVLREAAVACFANAQCLYAEANLLLEHGHGARAAALAIIGCEEFAKAVAHTLGALLPEQRDILARRLNELQKRHDVKHLITDMADAAQIENSEGWSVAADEAGYGPSPEQRLTDMFISLARWGVSELVMTREDARKEYKTRDELLRSSRLAWEVDDPPPVHPSPLKEAALYVDLTQGGKIRTPKRVEDRGYPTILSLEYFLEEYRALPEVLETEAKWTIFCSHVRDNVYKSGS